MAQLNLAQYKTIAIINYNQIGDLLCTVPLIKFCRFEAPQSKITLIVGPKNFALTPFLDDHDEVIVLPIRKKQKYLPLIKNGLRLRKKFDLVICPLEPRKPTNIFIKLLAPQNSIAYVKNNWHGKFIKTRIPFDTDLKKTKHEALDILNVIAPQYKELPQNLAPKIVIPEAIKNKYQISIETKLAPIKATDSPLLLISASNNRDNARISSEDYAKYLNQLAQTYAFKVVISYLERDQKLATAIHKKLSMPAVMVTTESLAEFLVLLNTADACFVGEGGIGHLAAALDKPQLVLFGRTSPVEWHPLSERATYLYDGNHVKDIPENLIMDKLRVLMQDL